MLPMKYNGFNWLKSASLSGFHVNYLTNKKPNIGIHNHINEIDSFFITKFTDNFITL